MGKNQIVFLSGTPGQKLCVTPYLYIYNKFCLKPLCYIFVIYFYTSWGMILYTLTCNIPYWV